METIICSRKSDENYFLRSYLTLSHFDYFTWYPLVFARVVLNKTDIYIG